MKKKNPSDPNVRRRSITDALLGDELSEDEASCDEYLRAAGIDASELISDFEARLKTEANATNDEAARNRINEVMTALHRNQSQEETTTVRTMQPPAGSLSGHATRYWTNRSVIKFAQGKNPIEAITEKAQSLIFDFMEQGAGVPVDPFALAEYQRAAVIPREDVRDARTIWTGTKFMIEFNPNRPQSRLRYSICHEIAHTLFPDCRERVRNRATHEEMESDEWQLEMLCNIAAAELLMPVGTFTELCHSDVSVEKVKDLQKEFQVSTEALLLRLAKLTSQRCGVFSASRKTGSPLFKIDYVVPSRSWNVRIPSGLALPKDTVIGNCTAIWYTDSGRETWSRSLGDLHIECIGIPPYPSQVHPRVMGIVRPAREVAMVVNKIHPVRRSATDLRGEGVKVVAQVVNDKTPRWGAGFALAVRAKWPHVQQQFEDWASKERTNLALGNVHAAVVDEKTVLISLICQHGYGPSPKPRIRYGALKKCLDQLRDIAIQNQATIHLPRIGAGQAGGNWDIIEEMIEDSLCRRGLQVFVYTLPDASLPESPQPRLKFD